MGSMYTLSTQQIFTEYFLPGTFPSNQPHDVKENETEP